MRFEVVQSKKVFNVNNRNTAPILLTSINVYLAPDGEPIIIMAMIAYISEIKVQAKNAPKNRKRSFCEKTFSINAFLSLWLILQHLFYDEDRKHVISFN